MRSSALDFFASMLAPTMIAASITNLCGLARDGGGSGEIKFPAGYLRAKKNGAPTKRTVKP